VKIARGRPSIIITAFGALGIISYFLPWIDEGKILAVGRLAIPYGSTTSKSAFSLSGGSGGYSYIGFLIAMIFCVVIGLAYGLTDAHAGDAALEILGGIFGVATAIWSTLDLSKSINATTEWWIMRDVSALEIGFYLAATATAGIFITALILAARE
jgi:hypothetical protein